MPRAGSGGGGGHHSSGGGHSSHRSGGGHRVSSGSSHRAMGGSSSYNRGPAGGGYGSPYRHTYHRGPGYPYGGYYDRPPRRRGCSSILVNIISYLILIMFLMAVFTRMGFGYSSGYSLFGNSWGNQGNIKSTINREKLDSKNAYINDCIIDEIGWFDNITSTSRRLKAFYDETGVQPYIILKAYDPSLVTDAQKDKWATDYYDENFQNENIFLYVYFAEKDTDNDVGYMAYANGYETSSVMDSEAVEIFWNYIDRYWYTDMSTDDLFVTVFSKTASTIMRVSTTMADVLKYLVIGVAAIVIICLLISFWKKKRQAEKERAEETERILNAGKNQRMYSDDVAEDLMDKYK